MKKIILFLSAVFSCLPVVADIPPVQFQGSFKNMLVYVEPEVARIVIRRHFSTMVTDYSYAYVSDLDNVTILKNVIDEYNNMLRDTGGYVSTAGLKEVCQVAFKDLMVSTQEPFVALSERWAKRRVIRDKCLAFARDLLTTELSQNDECEYDIAKDGGSQMRIKYTNKIYQTGFIRKNGTLAWRFFNPGALRDSPYKCTRFDTKPNGKFAVFDSEYRGRLAMRWLLENGAQYQGKTVRQAIPIYAPQKENNTAKYIRDLARQGVDIDKLLIELNDIEWEELLDAISQIEGWNTAGITEEF